MALVQLEMGYNVSDKPNKTPYLESPERGKFAVLVFFTKQELKELELHCNREKINISKWILSLVKDELSYYDEESDDE